MSQKSKQKFHLKHVTLSQLEASVTQLVFRSPVVGHSVSTWLDPSRWGYACIRLARRCDVFSRTS